MSKVKVNYTQTCDFCHKEKAVPIDGMFRIMLPGIFISSDGSKHSEIVKGDICPDCLTRLKEYLSRQLVLEEMDYGGTHIAWKDDVINGEKG